MATRNRRSARDAGTRFESDIAKHLAGRLNDDRIERRTRNGAKDRGDIAGVRTITGERVVIECKNTSRDNLPAWLREAEQERGNDDAWIAVVVHKAHGRGAPADQHVSMTLEMFCRLLEGGVNTEPVIVADPHTITGEGF